MFFSSTFCYTILQNLKDSIVVTTVGAEALPFLEAFVVLPISLCYFVLYNKLNRVLPEKWVYQAALAPLLGFYALFGAVLYPLASQLHPTHLLDSLRAALPDGLVGLAGMLIHWSYSLFFASGELWGGVAISVLFWGLADEVCTMSEAKSVYPLLGFVANIGLVAAGAYIKTVNAHLSAANHVLSVQLLLGTIMPVACILFGLKGYVHDNFTIHDPQELAAKEAKRKAAAAAKAAGQAHVGGSWRDSLGVLQRSPKVGNLAILVIAYFISQKLFDFAFKAQLRVLYPSAVGYQTVLADVAQYTGIATMVLMSVSKYVFQWGGWTTAALATPVCICVSGAVFFASAVVMQGNAAWLGPHAVTALVAAGSVAGIVGRVASRAPKYSLFDPAKEMVYITMSKDEKNEGKATVDLLGSYFGKSGASWIMQILVLTMGSLTKAMPVMGLVHLTICVLWVRSTVTLGNLMQGHMDPVSPSPPSPPPASPAPAGLPGHSSHGHISFHQSLPAPASPLSLLQPSTSSTPAAAQPVSDSNGHGVGNGNGNGASPAEHLHHERAPASSSSNMQNGGASHGSWSRAGSGPGHENGHAVQGVARSSSPAVGVHNDMVISSISGISSIVLGPEAFATASRTHTGSNGFQDGLQPSEPTPQLAGPAGHR